MNMLHYILKSAFTCRGYIVAVGKIIFLTLFIWKENVTQLFPGASIMPFTRKTTKLSCVYLQLKRYELCRHVSFNNTNQHLVIIHRKFYTYAKAIMLD